MKWGFKRHRNKPFESGYWYANLKCPGGDVRFGLRLDHDKSNKPYILVINGSQVVQVNDVTLQESKLRIEFPHHESVITASVDRKALEMKGTWRKRLKNDEWREHPFFASMKSDRSDSDYGGKPNFYDFYGKWRINFSANNDSTVAEFDTSRRGDFRHEDVRQFRGTVSSATKDYGHLSGDMFDGKLELSTFDGNNAILLRAELEGKGKLKGDFWSGEKREAWTATRD